MSSKSPSVGSNPFKNEAAEFVYVRTYSKWMDGLGRRETWDETVDRFINFIKDTRGDIVPKEIIESIDRYVRSMKVLPSMRMLWAAGKAATADNLSIYNCSFMVVDSVDAFRECLYALMCGTGLGFRVLKDDVDNLPQVPESILEAQDTHTVGDSKAGWSDSVDALLKALYAGSDLNMDYSKVRPMGSRLMTMGGRASGPGPLMKVHEFIRSVFYDARGRKLKPIEVHDIMNQIAEAVRVGGTRRSSQISLSDIGDEEMRNAKAGDFPARRWMANNSAVYFKKPSRDVFDREWLALKESGTGERGIFNLGGIRNRAPERRNKNEIEGVNPCITGDTLVYVADGRGSVPIRELADKGSDIPVFCRDNDGNVTIRYMRSPRITGYNKEIYELLLDDGSTIRATKNHKFLTLDGNYKELQHLVPGDSLKILTKFESSIKKIFKEKNTGQDYYWVNAGFSGRNIGEHRLIAAFHNNIDKLHKGLIVHHRDHDAKNNAPDNLEIMSKKEHDKLHALDMVEDKNPMRRARYEWSNEKWNQYRKKRSEINAGEKNASYKGITHEDLKRHAIKLTNKLGRRFSNDDWLEYAKENGLPQNFSKWRRDHLGSLKGLAKWAVLNSDIPDEIKDLSNLNPRTVKKFKHSLEEGYDAYIKNGTVWFIKNCEGCGKEIHTKIKETGVCNISCSGVHKTQGFISKLKRSLNNTHEKLRVEKREAQIKAYKKIKQKLNRDPQKVEWVEYCKNIGISYEISRKSSPFRSWKQLKNEASNYNHKVVSVTFVDYENVYNGTVDEFHNFYVGGFESNTHDGKKKWQYINNLQCGEIPLKNKQLCNLSETVVRPEDDLDSLIKKVEVATWIGAIQSTYTYFPYMRDKWRENCEKERLLGVSITGQMDAPHLMTAENLSKLKKASLDIARIASTALGINMPAAITCVKPSGTASSITDVSSGIHPRFSKYYIRRYRINAMDPLRKMLADQGIGMEPENGQGMSDWAKASAIYKDTKDLSLARGACTIYDPKKNWHHSFVDTWVVSFPIASPKNAILASDMTALEQLENYKKVQTNWCEHNVSITVYVGEDEWQEVGEWVYDNWDDIGGVSFLPRSEHTYRQAPYESITKEQYKRMAANMPKIDYSKLHLYEQEDNTEGAQTLACMGGTCELI